MAVHLASLTTQTLPCPRCDVPRQATPHVPAGDEAAHGPHPGVGRPVQMVKYLSAVRQGHQGAERTGRHVPPQFQITYLFEANPQSRGMGQLLYLLAKNLLQGHLL
jgi:hypothetical protein